MLVASHADSIESNSIAAGGNNFSCVIKGATGRPKVGQVMTPKLYVTNNSQTKALPPAQASLTVNGSHYNYAKLGFTAIKPGVTQARPLPSYTVEANSGKEPTALYEATVNDTSKSSDCSSSFTLPEAPIVSQPVYRYTDSQTSITTLSFDAVGPDKTTIGEPANFRAYPTSSSRTVGIHELSQAGYNNQYLKESAAMDNAIKLKGWKDNGIKFYAYAVQSTAKDRVPVYQFEVADKVFKLNYLYTGDPSEKALTAGLVWKNDGSVFFAPKD